MSIAVVCPECSAKLNAPDSAAGKRVKCPKCQAAMTVPAAVAEEPAFEVVEEPATEPKPRPKARAIVEDEKPRKRRVEAEVEDDDADDDDRPRKKKRKRADDGDAGSSRMVRNIIGGVVLLVLLGVAGWVYYDKYGKPPREIVIERDEDEQPPRFVPPPKVGPVGNNAPEQNPFPASSLTPEHEAAAKELQGNWTVVTFHTDLGTTPVPEGQIVPYTFKGNILITVGPGNVKVEREFRLDPSKEPKEIDQRFTGGTIGPWIAKGIYKLEGDTLTICSGGPNAARPTEFTKAPQDGRSITVFKRLKE